MQRGISLENNLEKRILNSIDARRNDIVEFLRDLVKIPSIAGDERQVQEFIASNLQNMRLKVDVWEPKLSELKLHPGYSRVEQDYLGRPVVVGVLKGGDGGKSFILNGHIDVVPPGLTSAWKHGPWSGDVEGGKLFGRGASDMKGGFAALVMAVKCLAEEEIRLNGDVIIESVVDEERSGNGTLACILRGYKADAGIIGEPTNLEVHLAHAGSTWFRVKIDGRAAHGGLRYEGVSAIEKAVQIHEALLKLEAQRSRDATHLLFKAYSNLVPLNIGTIKAGVWPSTVPEECIMEGRIGYLPNEVISSVRHQLEDCVKQTAKKDAWMRKHQPKVEWLGVWDASEIAPGHKLAKLFKTAYKKILKQEPRVSASPWGTDMRLLVKYARIPTLLFGPGEMRQAHSVNECIQIQDVMKATKIIALTLIKWCGYQS